MFHIETHKVAATNKRPPKIQRSVVEVNTKSFCLNCKCVVVENDGCCRTTGPR